MKPQTVVSAPITLVKRFDISSHVQQVGMHVRFLHSRHPTAAELVQKIKRVWPVGTTSIEPGTDRAPLMRTMDETSKDLLALGAGDPVMKPYASRVLQALDSLSVVLAKSDEEYAREQMPTDRNQIILDKIRELLASA